MFNEPKKFDKRTDFDIGKYKFTNESLYKLLNINCVSNQVSAYDIMNTPDINIKNIIVIAITKVLVYYHSVI